MVFFLNSIDAFTCKKLGYFIYEAFALRNGQQIQELQINRFRFFVSFSFLCAMAFVIGNANKLLLLFEMKALIDRIVGAWKLKLRKNITRHYLPKGLTMLFLLTVIAILVNELLRKMIINIKLLFLCSE